MSSSKKPLYSTGLAGALSACPDRYCPCRIPDTLSQAVDKIRFLVSGDHPPCFCRRGVGCRVGAYLALVNGMVAKMTKMQFLAVEWLGVTLGREETVNCSLEWKGL